MADLSQSAHHIVEGAYIHTEVDVSVPSVTDPDIGSVEVTVTGAARGDFVLAAPTEALPTNAFQQGAYVSDANDVTIVFGSKGGNITGADVNYSILVIPAVDLA